MTETVEITVDGLVVGVRFTHELGHLIAIITAPDPLLTSCLTAAWKLVPAQLIESLLDHRAVTYGEFFTFAYEIGPDRDPNEAEGVHIREDEGEVVLPLETFKTLIVALARLHLSRVEPAKLSWYSGLSAAARDLIR